MKDIMSLTPAEVGIVKLAAAQHMKSLVPNIRPETAEYIFARRVIKEANAGKKAEEADAGLPDFLKDKPAKKSKKPAKAAVPPAQAPVAEAPEAGDKDASAKKLAAAILTALKQGKK